MHDPKPQGITHPDVTTAEGITVTSPTNCYTHIHNTIPLTLTESISSTSPSEDLAFGEILLHADTNIKHYTYIVSKCIEGHLGRST